MIRKNLQTILTLVIITVMLSLTACNPSAKLEKQEKEDIQAFLGSTDSIFVKQQSGLYYNEIVPGTGVSPKIADSAYVKYTGKFLDESIFDSNVTTGKLYGFIIGQNIAGFDEGITLMKPGGKSTLLIPSKLAYGASGTYGIPGYTPLLFDIELVKTVPHTGQ
jgi:FKBP-type peptidyl-prolyl cis-trans isomerase FkpA